MKGILLKLKRAWFLILLFLPQLAWADNGISSILSFNTFKPTPGDWSVSFLRQIFGEVGNGMVLTGAPQTIIGKLFGVFNSAMLVLISVVIIYIITKTIVDIASFGEILGNKKISHWTAIRTAFGIGLLVPTASGYSYIQIIIMWAVIQGIGLADQAWTTAVTYLKQGGVVYSTPAQIAEVDKTKLVLVDSVITPKEPDAKKIGSTDVLSSLICMHTIEHAIDSKNAAKKQYYLDHPEDAPKDQAKYRELMNQLDTKTTLQPGYNTDPEIATVTFPKISKEDLNYKDISQFNGACGVYSWGVENDYPAGDSVSQADADQVTQNYLQSKQVGVQQMILIIDPLAKDIVDEGYKDSENNINTVVTDDQLKTADYYIINSTNAYQSIIYPAAIFAASLDEKGSTYVDDDMIDAGWAAAARYYFYLSKNVTLPGLDSKYNKPNYQITVDSTYPPAIETQDFMDIGRQGGLQNVENKLDSYSNNTVDKEVLDKALKKVNKIRVSSITETDQRNKDIASVDAANKEMPDLSSSAFFTNKKNFKLQGFDISSAILAGEVGKVVHTWFDYMVPGDDSKYNLPPISKLQGIGDAMMKGAHHIWLYIFLSNLGLNAGLTVGFTAAAAANSVAALIGTTFFGISSGFFTSVATGINTAAGLATSFANSIAFMSLPLVIAVTGPLFLTGAILSTYVPLIPFMLFTFGVISWLIFVVEAMAAAPLVALGITHPEGHDLMGKAEQALMLWLSVFLRPIAMIIGLIAGMVLIHIAMTVLNAGFGGIVSDLFGDKVSSFKGITVMLVYTFFVVALVNQCFGLIHVIPEKIMRWIGLHPEGSEAPQLMESIKGGITPFIESTGAGAGKVSSESSQQISGAVNKAGEAGREKLAKITEGLDGKEEGGIEADK